MQFEIDYTRAKALATRLQDFLSENPRPKLSRSSSIEAVARMLGFNNRNEMAARLNAADATSPADAAATPSPATSAQASLEALLEAESEACARIIVAAGRSVSPGTEFTAAIAVETAAGTPLHIAEQKVSATMDTDPRRRTLLHAALLHSGEFDACREERRNLSEICSMALVNHALPRAETIWGRSGSDDERAWQDLLSTTVGEAVHGAFVVVAETQTEVLDAERDDETGAEFEHRVNEACRKATLRYVAEGDLDETRAHLLRHGSVLELTDDIIDHHWTMLLEELEPDATS